MKSSPSFADKLREVREQKSLSQEDLAQLSKVSSDVVSRLERGVVEAKPAQIVALSLALQVSTDVLLGLSSAEEEPESESLADVRRLLRVSRRLGARELNLVAQIAEALALKESAS